MEIKLNDRSITLDAGTTLTQLLESEGIQGRYVAVAIDQVIVKAIEWESRVLKDGESVIVIGAIKGG